MSSPTVESRPHFSLSTPISGLGLSNTIENRLHAARIATVGELIEKSEEEMLALPRIGVWMFEEIKGKLEGVGLKFRVAPPKWVDPADWRRGKRSEITRARMSAAQQRRHARARAAAEGGVR